MVTVAEQTCSCPTGDAGQVLPCALLQPEGAHSLHSASKVASLVPASRLGITEWLCDNCE